MAAQVSLDFRNNQNWFLAVDVTGLAVLYDLTVGQFRLQIRRNLGDVLPVYAFSSDPDDGVGGAIAYDSSTNLIYVTAPYGDMASVSATSSQGLPAGGYVYDLVFSTTGFGGASVIEALWYGTLTVDQGVTLQ